VVISHREICLEEGGEGEDSPPLVAHPLCRCLVLKAAVDTLALVTTLLRVAHPIHSRMEDLPRMVSLQDMAIIRTRKIRRSSPSIKGVRQIPRIRTIIAEGISPRKTRTRKASMGTMLAGMELQVCLVMLPTPPTAHLLLHPAVICQGMDIQVLAHRPPACQAPDITIAHTPVQVPIPARQPTEERHHSQVPEVTVDRQRSLVHPRLLVDTALPVVPLDMDSLRSPMECHLVLPAHLLRTACPRVLLGTELHRSQVRDTPVRDKNIQGRPKR
jgi:hypothetical protein